MKRESIIYKDDNEESNINDQFQEIFEQNKKIEKKKK